MSRPYTEAARARVEALQRDLRAMVEMGLLVPEGATNRLFYRLGKAAS